MHPGGDNEASNSKFALDFEHFVKNAYENELEDVLTLFTKRNKSAAIFLGTKTKKDSKDISESSEKPKPTLVHGAKLKSTEPTLEEKKLISALQRLGQKPSSKQSKKDSTGSKNIEPGTPWR